MRTLGYLDVCLFPHLLFLYTVPQRTLVCLPVPQPTETLMALYSGEGEAETQGKEVPFMSVRLMGWPSVKASWGGDTGVGSVR